MTVRDPGPSPDAGVLGQVFAVENGIVRGWAWRPSEPQAHCTIQVWRGDAFVAEGVADQFVESLAVGDGRHGFAIDVSHLATTEVELLEVFAAGQDEPLDGGVIQLSGRGLDGVVGYPGYLDTPEAIAAIETTPYEHYAYEAVTLAHARLAPRLLNRLRRERGAYAAGPDYGTAVLLELGGAASRAGWELQSYPHVSRLVAPTEPQALRAAVQGAGKVFFASTGDALHPSTAGICMRLSADVVAWHRFEPSEWMAGAPGRLFSYPPFDIVTARCGAATDTAFCVRGALLASAPDPVLEALAAGRLHPLMFWLSGQRVVWDHHPEALTIGSPPAGVRSMSDDEMAACEQALDEEGEFQLVRRPAPAEPAFTLLPRRRAAKISVLICFKNYADSTLATLHSIYRQRLSGELEIVLVDNQSTGSEAARVREGATMLFGAERVVFLTYDKAFNHSAQNNLAARAASGDVLVICNNDITLTDPTALEQLGAWALCEGVGAVGCRLSDPNRGLGSYGHSLGPPAASPFRVAIGENTDPAFADFVHATPGATLALAAIETSRFFSLGGLDEEDFPIGYNDVEFMLRATRGGLRHLYVGHVHARHDRGSSRTGDNEALQALRINALYGHELSQHRRHLAAVTVPAGPKAKVAPSATAASALKQATRAREREARRLAAVTQLDEIRAQVDERHHAALSKVQALILDG